MTALEIPHHIRAVGGRCVVTDLEINLGVQYRDQISQFTGVCTAVCNELDGSKRARLVGQANDGKVPVEWFPAERLERT